MMCGEVVAVDNIVNCVNLFDWEDLCESGQNWLNYTSWGG